MLRLRLDRLDVSDLHDRRFPGSDHLDRYRHAGGRTKHQLSRSERRRHVSRSRRARVDHGDTRDVYDCRFAERADTYAATTREADTGTLSGHGVLRARRLRIYRT